ncbi:MAG TPA: cytochrome P450 [Gammaproteobacteria bacterium]|nr:cytochrome P450 [Gammaproteobacteria bacterium]HIL95210.1 cytochrome P450 [Pseudomonadales bacterium]
MRSGDLSVSNAEVLKAFAIDPDYDPYSVPLDEMDPGHPSLFEHDTLWSHFERLRSEDPVHYTEESMFGPYWSITRYRDVMHIDTNHKVFSSKQKLGGIALGGVARDDEYALPMFIQEDPPKHDAQRKVVTPMFLPKNLAELEPLIRERAGEILDNLPVNEEFNFVKEVSVELTGQMLATLFDVPQEDRLKLIYWSDTVSNIGNPEFFDTPEQGFQELFNCLAYFTEFYEERKKQPLKFDLISMLGHDESTRDMSPQELLGNILLLIVGGNDTTRNSITGGVLALNQNPGEYEKLMQNPGLIPKMVPEIIRWQSPVAHMARTALEDYEFEGKQIKKGDKVVMWYISGNRDEGAIQNANQFIIDRENPRQHTAFGYGVHRCVGNRLAEMQLRVVWEEMMKRFSKIEVVGDPVLLPSSFIHGIRELPVMVRDN